MYHIGKLRKSLTILLLLLIVKLYYLINMSPTYENSNNSQLFIQEKKLVENFLLFQKHSIIYSGKKKKTVKNYFRKKVRCIINCGKHAFIRN